MDQCLFHIWHFQFTLGLARWNPTISQDLYVLISLNPPIAFLFCALRVSQRAYGTPVFQKEKFKTTIPNIIQNIHKERQRSWGVQTGFAESWKETRMATWVLCAGVETHWFCQAASLSHGVLLLAIVPSSQQCVLSHISLNHLRQTLPSFNWNSGKEGSSLVASPVRLLLQIDLGTFTTIWTTKNPPQRDGFKKHTSGLGTLFKAVQSGWFTMNSWWRQTSVESRAAHGRMFRVPSRVTVLCLSYKIFPDRDWKHCKLEETWEIH